jgi:CheY-like chemotaxis protein
LVASMADLLRRTLGEQIDLRSELAADIWLAFTDANQLENALLNLAINSRDAMPMGGTLTISTANIRLAEPHAARYEGLEPGDYILIRVADTGSGMSPEVLAKAADPFFTTKSVGTGTGLGLSMIYGFLRQSRGHLHIASQVGQGTTVELYLPRALQDAIKLDAPATVARTGQGETVLVVEDDPTVRSIVGDVLEELHYTILKAPDARAAIPILQSNQKIDLMVSDVVLPHINGRKLAEVARAARPDLKVLFVSGYAEDARLRVEFLDRGMDMLMKPFDLEALAAKVRLLIEQ